MCQRAVALLECNPMSVRESRSFVSIVRYGVDTNQLRGFAECLPRTAGRCEGAPVGTWGRSGRPRGTVPDPAGVLTGWRSSFRGVTA